MKDIDRMMLEFGRNAYPAVVIYKNIYKTSL